MRLFARLRALSLLTLLTFPAFPACDAPSAPPSTGAAGPASEASAKPKRKLIPVWEPLPDVLPAFTEPAAGPRAPDNAAFSVRLGESTLAEVQAVTAQFGEKCMNRSIRTVMERAREAKAKEVEKARAEGKGPDTVTGASILMVRSPRETSPQVRWSCEDVDPAGLPVVAGERPRPSILQTRLLYVFDSKAHPVRLAALQRSWPKDKTTEAIADLRDALASLTLRYGAPTSARGELPPAPKAPGEKLEIPAMRNYLFEWTYSDLKIKLNGVNLPKGMTISEDVEVPVPVRPDAPARSKK